MAETKVYTIPLRREFQKAPFKRKTNKAVRALKQFVEKHTKADTILVGEELNEHMWSKGITNPPGKVQVEITTETKDDKKEAFVNLVGFGKKVVKSSKKGILSKENAGLQGKLKDAVQTLKGKADDGAEEATETEAPKEEKKAAPKKAPAKKPAVSKAETKTEAKPAEEKKEAPKAEEAKADKKEE